MFHVTFACALLKWFFCLSTLYKNELNLLIYYFLSFFGWQKCNLRCDLLFSRSLIVFFISYLNVFTYATLISFCSSFVCFALSFISNAITKWWKVIYNLQFCVYFLRFLFIILIFCDLFPLLVAVWQYVCVCVFFCVSHDCFFCFLFSH